MNILDVDSKVALEEAKAQFGVEDPIALIFARQRELMEKYLPIEESLIGHAPDVPVNIDSAVDQAELKQRAWWVAEELGEALDAWWDGMPLKALEELSDAIHLITELAILSDVRVDQGSVTKNVLREIVFEMAAFQVSFPHCVMLIFVDLAMSMWQLRNKPWKQSQIQTDVPAFGMRLTSAYLNLLATAMKFWNLSLEEVAVVYLQKSVVNKFRIKSQY